MKFDFITMHVKNMEDSLRFYNEYLGLPLRRRQQIPGGQLAFLGEENAPQIELIYTEGEPPAACAGFSVGIAVPNLEEATAALAAKGHPVIRGPVSPTPGTVFSFVKDPNGAEIELIEYNKNP